MDLNSKPMKLLLLLAALSCIGCKSYVNEMKQVYDDRQRVIQMFSNVSVFRDQRTSYTFLYTYNNGKQNQYVFSHTQNGYSFLRDSTLFSPDKILDIASEYDSSAYKRQLEDKIAFYLQKMDSLNISDVSSEFIPQGITLKIYMKSKAILIYVADPKIVNNPEWINYLKSMKKFDDHWYYAKKDR